MRRNWPMPTPARSTVRRRSPNALKTPAANTGPDTTGRAPAWQSESQLDFSYLFYLLLAGLVAIGAVQFVRYSWCGNWAWGSSDTAGFIGILSSAQRGLHQGHYWGVSTPLFNPRSFYDRWLPYVVIPLMLLAAGWIGAVFVRRSLSARPREFRWTAWLKDRLLYYSPVVAGAYRPGQWALAIRNLADAVAAGHTIAEAVQSAQAGLGGVVSQKLIGWQNLLECGAAPGPAAVAAGLPQLLCDCLENAGSALLAPSLGYAADVFEHRRRKRVEFLQCATIPAAVLALGALVLWVEYSFWHFYATVITAVEHKGPY